MSTTRDIVILVATTRKEKQEAIEYINTRMIEVFQCDPPETTGLILVGKQNDIPVASIVMYAPDPASKLPLEMRYDFCKNSIDEIRSEVVEGSRWLASIPDVSLLILKTAAEISLQLGKKYMLIEAKEYSVKRLRQL
ncbi:hypothetical protein KKH15_03355, partial [Patescibacteria group bacterium]|nr:hypothetical protein [Patescibacteria group bacterium]MBU1754822.1 hypothetical protein [Patescibacteria group bacterium]